jgi:hypothetical protein
MDDGFVDEASEDEGSMPGGGTSSEPLSMGSFERALTGAAPDGL